MKKETWSGMWERSNSGGKLEAGVAERATGWGARGDEVAACGNAPADAEEDLRHSADNGSKQ